MTAPIWRRTRTSRNDSLSGKIRGSMKVALAQRGIALLALLGMLTLVGIHLFISQLNSTRSDYARSTEEESQLAIAKQALIGDAISSANLLNGNNIGRLRVPDIGEDLDGTPTEGIAGANNNILLSVIGKFPWRTLSTGPLRDRHTECLWLATSGRFKRTANPTALNWDSLGQIDVIDGQNNLITTNLAALLIAPGTTLDGQDRSLSDQTYRQCGGNYNTKNYLDTFNVANGIAGLHLNYFPGSINNRLAPDANNKRFVLADSAHYNDRLLFVTVDDIFSPLMRRSDFALAIRDMMDKVAALNPVPSGNKGVPDSVCETGTPTDTFCANWKEMLFLAQLPIAAPIIIDETPTANSCSRVLIFGGRRTAGQQRTTETDKANKSNYLEAPNATSFNAPIALGTSFSGVSQFDWRHPERDILRCLPVP